MAGGSEEATLAERGPTPSDERPDIWKSEGNSRLTAGDDAGAAQCYTRGIDAANQVGVAGKLLSQLHANRAQAFIKLGRLPEAIEDCRTAIRSDASNAKAYWRGANAALKLEQPAVAADLCEQGIKAVGDSLGLAALLDEARERLQVSAEKSQIKEAPQGASLITGQDLANRGAAMLSRYKASPTEGTRDIEDAQGARRLFERALAEDPGNETALLGLGDILDEGLGVERDPQRAGQFWLQAQERGSRKAQVKLSLQGLSSWAVMARAMAFGEAEDTMSPANLGGPVADRGPITKENKAARSMGMGTPAQGVSAGL